MGQAFLHGNNGSVVKRNLLDNSDFTQFIAQAMLGQAHGTQLYAGDRWKLVDGTVTGEGLINVDTVGLEGTGDIYTNVVLDGTIQQIVADPPEGECTCVLEMESGTGTAVYADGVVTITSSGGTLKNVGLYAGKYTPRSYTPKGIIAELMECQRYFYAFPNNMYVNCTLTGAAKSLYFNFWLPAMRITPTIVANGVKCIVRTIAGYSTETSTTSSFISPTTVRFLKYNPLACGDSISFDFTKALGDNNRPATVRIVGADNAPPPLTFVADL